MPLAHYLNVVSKAYLGAYMKSFEGHDLERYFIVLGLLDIQNKPLTQQDLCTILTVDKVTMVRILDYLEEKGYVNRIVNKEDRRERKIELTEKARKNLKYIHSVITNMNNHAFEGFSEQDKNIFFNLLQRIGDNMMAMPSEEILISLKRSKKGKQ
jgi:DNA-binding MarR family transcriptional regulator